MTLHHNDDEVRPRMLADANLLIRTGDRVMNTMLPLRMRAFGEVQLLVQTNDPWSDYHGFAHLIVDQAKFVGKRRIIEKAYPRRSPIVPTVYVEPPDDRPLDTTHPHTPFFDESSTLDRRPVTGEMTATATNRYEQVQPFLALHRAGLDARLIMFGYELYFDYHDVRIETVDLARAKDLGKARSMSALHRDKERLTLLRRRNAKLPDMRDLIPHIAGPCLLPQDLNGRLPATMQRPEILVGKDCLTNAKRTLLRISVSSVSGCLDQAGCRPRSLKLVGLVYSSGCVLQWRPIDAINAD